MLLFISLIYTFLLDFILRFNKLSISYFRYFSNCIVLRYVLYFEPSQGEPCTPYKIYIEFKDMRYEKTTARHLMDQTLQ